MRKVKNKIVIHALFNIVLIFLPIVSYCQFKISGKVVDIDSNPIEFAEVIIYENDTIPIKSELSDEKGVFSILVSGGKQRILIRQLGEIIYDERINIAKNIDLGVVKHAIVREMQEVVISGESKLIERRMDRLIYNVGVSVFSSGVSGDELLKNMPRIDPASDGLKMIGKSNVLIMINDRLLNLSDNELKNFLKSLRSENIEKIEIITNPSAKYDAAGNSGLINIKLKKNNNLGFNGSASTTLIQRSKFSLGESLNLNYSTEKLFVGYNLYYGNERRSTKHTNEYLFPEEVRLSNEKSVRNNKGLSNNISLDYQINGNSNIGFYANQNAWNNSIGYRSIIHYKNVDEGIFRTQDLSSINSSRYKSVFISPYYDIQLDSLGSKLKLSYNYVNNSTKETNNLYSKTYKNKFESIENISSSRSLNTSDFSVNSLNIDLELIRRIYKVQIGAKYANFRTLSNANFWDTTTGIETDPNLSNNFSFREEYSAGYINISRILKEVIYASVGLRYEYTNTEGILINKNEQVANSYGNLFPSLTVSYEPSENNSYTFSYNRRIMRPSFIDVIPLRVYRDAYNYSVGNANLLPSMSDNIELEYLYKGNLSLIIFGSRISNNTATVRSSQDGNQIIITQPRNVLTTYDIGGEIGFNWQISKMLNSYSSFNLARQKSFSSDIRVPDENLVGLNAAFTSNTNFVWDKEKNNRLFVNAFYAFPGIEELYQSKSIFLFRVGTNISLFKRRLDVTIYATDVFNTTISRNFVSYDNFTLNNRIFNDNRNVAMSLTYKFGNTNSRRPNRKIDSSDKERLYKED